MIHFDLELACLISRPISFFQRLHARQNEKDDDGGRPRGKIEPASDGKANCRDCSMPPCCGGQAFDDFTAGRDGAGSEKSDA